MKRANEERPRTLRVWQAHRAGHVNSTIRSGGELGVRPEDSVDCICDNQAGRFRKGERVGGCSCGMCKYEKLNNIPKIYQILANISYREQLDECDAALRASLSRRKRF